MSLLANEFDIWSIVHGQVSLAAVNKIYVFHEAMTGCKKKSKDSLKASFENEIINISLVRLKNLACAHFYQTLFLTWRQ